MSSGNLDNLRLYLNFLGRIKDDVSVECFFCQNFKQRDRCECYRDPILDEPSKFRYFLNKVNEYVHTHTLIEEEWWGKVKSVYDSMKDDESYGIVDILKVLINYGEVLIQNS